jgi:hypothetical protein
VPKLQRGEGDEMKMPQVREYVIYKFDRKIVGGTTEQQIGRAPGAVKIEGVEAEARAIVLRMHEEDFTVDLEVYAQGGQYIFGHVANGMAEGQWHTTLQAADAQKVGAAPAAKPAAG